jgi:hypothetical protein
MTDAQPAQTLRLGVLSDLHLAPAGTPPTEFNTTVRLGQSRELLRAALVWLTPRADALALLGDLSQSATPGDYRYLAGQLGSTGLPGYVIPGNHDIPAERRTAAIHTAIPRRLQASLVTPGCVSHGPAVIASAHLTAQDDGFRVSQPRLTRPSPACRPLIFLTHFPVLDMRLPVERSGLRYAGNLANRAEIQHALHDYGNPVIVLSGHLHVRGHAIAGNILQLCMAALAERPSDATIVTITSRGTALKVTRHSHSLASDTEAPAAALDPSRTRFAWQHQRWQPEPMTRSS